MGTLKSVCSSWFALISCDIYEHTHLRVPIEYFRASVFLFSPVANFGNQSIFCFGFGNSKVTVNMAKGNST